MNTNLNTFSVRLDRDVSWVLVARLWMIFAGGLTVILIPIYLSPYDQGYYFTFLSLLTLQIFFELGLNQVVVQLVSHEVTGPGGDGDTPHVTFTLSKLLSSLRRWYGAIAVIFSIIVTPVGFIFFGSSLDISEPPLFWWQIWCVLVFSTAANLFLSAFLAASEGYGMVAEVARLRLIQNAIGYVAFWVALYFGAGLGSICLVPICNNICTLVWLSRQRWLRARPDRLDASRTISWKIDVFPLQWRMAVSWISGYFIFNLFVPLAFTFHGAVSAGRLGLAFSVFNSITTLGMSLMNAKYPLMGRLIAAHDRGALDDLFDTWAPRALIVNLLICIGFVGFIFLSKTLGLGFAARISDVPTLAVMSVIVLCNTAISSMALYMRAHKEEPMLLVSVVVAALVGLCAAITVKASVFWMVLSYAGVVLFVSLPWTGKLWKTYRGRSFAHIVDSDAL